MLLDAKNEDFISLAAYCRDRVNPYLYQYALSIALLHRPDTKNYPIPSHLSSFPELFMDRSVFAQAREEVNVVPQGSRVSYLLSYFLSSKRYEILRINRRFYSFDYRDRLKFLEITHHRI